LTSNVNMNDGDGGPNGDLTYNNALSVTIGASSGMYSLVANSATTITLGEDVYTGGSVYVGSTSALTINMSNMTGANGPLTINTPNAALVDLSGLVTLTGDVDITTDSSPAGTVLLPNYTGSGNNHSVTITGPVTQDMPKFMGSLLGHDIFSSTIITITLAKYQMAGDLNGLAVARYVTVGDVKNDVDASNLNEGSLRNIWITASSYSVDVYFNSSFGDLNTISTAGLLHGLKADNTDVLTTVTTAGQMDRLELWHNPALVTVAIGHNFYNNVIGEGTWLFIWDNDALTSLNTNTITGSLKLLYVGGNAVLSTVNFSSLVAGNNITAGAITVFVADNALEGTYTPSVFVTNTAPVMVQSGLSTLKAYVQNLYSNPAYNVLLTLGYNVGAGTTDNMIANLDADRANHILAGGTALTTFVNRNGDIDGGVGTRIGVARELNYLQ
jgi:hypothetical protein